MKKSPGVALDLILKSLSECNSIKYVAYRTSVKIRILQKAFYLEKLPVEVIGGVLQQHHLTCTENSVRLTPSELCNLLEDVYFIVSREHFPAVDIDHSVNVLCRFLLHVLQKNAGVELLGVKVLLSVLCGSKPRDKYNYLFSQLADHNSVLTARRLELLLQRLVLLTDFIGEGRSFGRSLVPGTVQSCFQDLPVGSLGVSLEVFTAWLSRDPQLLVWLSTLHRLHLADTVVHDVKCSVCKAAPIVGLRYRCLRCLTYNQCQNCFFSGTITRNHKKNHPVQEYCYQSTAKQSLRALLATLRNKLRRSGWKLQYLPAESRDSYLEETTLQLDQLEESTRTLTHNSALSFRELENIIAELEEQSKKLLRGADGITPELKNVLDSHRNLLQKQIERLKTLKCQLERQKRSGGMVNSTPCARLAKRGAALEAISPITANSLALTWDKYDIGAPEEGPCVLTWDEGAEPTLTDMEPHPISSHAYTWLQSTGEVNSKTAGFGVNENKDIPVKIEERPEDIQALHNDLDQILDRLQELLSNSSSSDLKKLTPTESEDGFGDVLERL